MAHKCDGCRYKGEHQEMMFRPFGVCTRETNLIDAEKAYNAEKCPYKQTNADRIRAMSDEEIAQWFCLNYSCTKCLGLDLCTISDGKANGLLKWLKQPVKENSDGKGRR